MPRCSKDRYRNNLVAVLGIGLGGVLMLDLRDLDCVLIDIWAYGVLHIREDTSLISKSRLDAYPSSRDFYASRLGVYPSRLGG